jgi:hypothetical protein
MSARTRLATPSRRSRPPRRYLLLAAGSPVPHARASWSSCSASFDREVLSTVPPNLLIASTALSGTTFSSIRNSAEVPGLTGPPHLVLAGAVDARLGELAQVGAPSCVRGHLGDRDEEQRSAQQPPGRSPGRPGAHRVMAGVDVVLAVRIPPGHRDRVGLDDQIPGEPARLVRGGFGGVSDEMAFSLLTCRYFRRCWRAPGDVTPDGCGQSDRPDRKPWAMFTMRRRCSRWLLLCLRADPFAEAVRCQSVGCLVPLVPRMRCGW